MKIRGGPWDWSMDLVHEPGPWGGRWWSMDEGEEKENYADVCKKFKELCEGVRNVIYERLVFNQRNQKRERGLIIMLVN